MWPPRRRLLERPRLVAWLLLRTLHGYPISYPSGVESVRRMKEQITQTSDIEARELRRGDDLFGAGEVKSAVWVGGSVQVQAGGTSFTFWPDETVTVRRAISP